MPDKFVNWQFKSFALQNNIYRYVINEPTLVWITYKFFRRFSLGLYKYTYEKIGEVEDCYTFLPI